MCKYVVDWLAASFFQSDIMFFPSTPISTTATNFRKLFLPSPNRNQKNGIQDQTVAREVLLLLRLQDRHRYQVVYPPWAGNLLRRLLRGKVRNTLHQVQEGKSKQQIEGTFFFSNKRLCSSRSSPAVVWPTRTNRGIVSASPAPTVRCPWPGSASPAATRSRTVPSASGNYSPRDAPPVSSQ